MMISIRISGTLVKVKPVVVLVLTALWFIVSWLGWLLHPYRTLPQALLIGLVSAFLMAVAEFGHPFAHIISARYAGAPMDELVISEGMPRTLYWNDSVPPNAHRLRALGGPIFNVLGLLLSVAVFVIASTNSLVREWASWSAFGHGVLLIESLFPVPMVDGGTLLKWTLVVGGMAPDSGGYHDPASGSGSRDRCGYRRRSVARDEDVAARPSVSWPQRCCARGGDGQDSVESMSHTVGAPAARRLHGRFHQIEARRRQSHQEGARQQWQRIADAQKSVSERDVSTGG